MWFDTLNKSQVWKPCCWQQSHIFSIPTGESRAFGIHAARDDAALGYNIRVDSILAINIFCWVSQEIYHRLAWNQTSLARKGKHSVYEEKKRSFTRVFVGKYVSHVQKPLIL